MTEVRYSSQLAVRVEPDIAAALDRAAVAQRMKTSELIRRIMVDRLQADGMLSNRVAEAS